MGGVAQRRRRRIDPIDVVDVFVYVVVLNLTAEFVPAVIVESFAVSIVTAVLLKLVLEVVLAVEGRIRRRMQTAATRAGKAAAAVALWVVLVGSKFVVLELENLVFGHAVSLGGFVPVALLVVALVGARAGTRRLLAPAGGGREPADQ